MKTFSSFNDFNEGIFSKKSPEDKKIDQLKDNLRKLASKSSGKGGWSKGEQEKYNSLWGEYKKLVGQPPKGPKPSVYFDSSKMSVYKHADLVKALHKKLGIK